MRRRERLDVGEARQRAAGVVVEVLLAGRRVGHRQVEFDVGQRAVEQPVMAVDARAVEHLDDQLGIGRVEEPEGAGIGGQRHRVAGGKLLRARVAEAHVEPEAVAFEAQAGRRGGTTGGAVALDELARQAAHRPRPENAPAAVVAGEHLLRRLMAAVALDPGGSSQRSAPGFVQLREGGREAGTDVLVPGHHEAPTRVHSERREDGPGRRHGVRHRDGRRDRIEIGVERSGLDRGDPLEVRIRRHPGEGHATGGACRQQGRAAEVAADRLDGGTHRRAVGVEAPDEDALAGLAPGGDEAAVGERREADVAGGDSARQEAGAGKRLAGAVEAPEDDAGSGRADDLRPAGDEPARAEAGQADVGGGVGVGVGAEREIAAEWLPRGVEQARRERAGVSVRLGAGHRSGAAGGKRNQARHPGRPGDHESAAGERRDGGPHLILVAHLARGGLAVGGRSVGGEVMEQQRAEADEE
jgi:hypothetical protein